jgi:hypothetical protein
MRPLVLFLVVLSFVALSTVPIQAQAGPCTESAIKEGHVPVADDTFSYMPPYGKPVVGKSEIKAANTKSASGGVCKQVASTMQPLEE